MNWCRKERIPNTTLQKIDMDKPCNLDGGVL